MSGIKYLITTELFWKSMAEYRRHGSYLVLRDKIDEVVYRKVQDKTSRGQFDKPFDNGGKLRDIWHAQLSRDFDAVLFYTVSGDELTLAALGNHGDYPHAGKHKHKAGPLADRIWNAVSTGQSVSPGWKKLKWNHPRELVDHRDLHEMDVRVLAAIRDELRAEMDGLSKFGALTGLDADDEANLEAVLDYIDLVERADNAVARASERAELSMKRHRTRIPYEEYRP